MPFRYNSPAIDLEELLPSRARDANKAADESAKQFIFDLLKCLLVIAGSIDCLRC